MDRYVRISAATFKTNAPKKHGHVNLKAHVFVNVPKSFISECTFATMNGIQPIVSYDLITNHKGQDKHETVIEMPEMFDRVFNSPAWDYNASFAIVTEADSNLEIEQGYAEPIISFRYSYGKS